MRCSDIGVMCVCIALELCSRVLHGCIIVSGILRQVRCVAGVRRYNIGEVLSYHATIRWCMRRLEESVQSGDRNCAAFMEVSELAAQWEGDRVGTQAHILPRQQLVVLKIRSHQADGVMEPSKCTVLVNGKADGSAREGASKEAVRNVVMPSVGSRFFICVGGRGGSGYVSQAVKAFGFDQADERLAQLKQQGGAARLHRQIGGDWGYYVPASGVWLIPEVCRFQTMMFESRMDGRGDKMQGMVGHGIGGVVRAHVRYSEVAKMMKVIGRTEQAWRGFVDGEAQVCRRSVSGDILLLCTLAFNTVPHYTITQQYIPLHMHSIQYNVTNS